MNVRNLKLIFLVLFLASFAFAQAPAKAEASTEHAAVNPDPPTHEQIVEFMRLMHADRQIVLIFDQMQRNMREGMRQGFLSKHPDASPAVLEKVDAIVPDFRKYVSTEDVMGVSEKLYARYLTKQELQAATAFYSSPEGQKLLEKIPVITQEAMRDGATLMESHSKELLADMQARMQELEKQIESERKAKQPSKGPAPKSGPTAPATRSKTPAAPKQ